MPSGSSAISRVAAEPGARGARSPPRSPCRRRPPRRSARRPRAPPRGRCARRRAARASTRRRSRRAPRARAAAPLEAAPRRAAAARRVHDDEGAQRHGPGDYPTRGRAKPVRRRATGPARQPAGRAAALQRPRDRRPPARRRPRDLRRPPLRGPRDLRRPARVPRVGDLVVAPHGGGVARHLLGAARLVPARLLGHHGGELRRARAGPGRRRGARRGVRRSRRSQSVAAHSLTPREAQLRRAVARAADRPVLLRRVAARSASASRAAAAGEVVGDARRRARSARRSAAASSASGDGVVAQRQLDRCGCARRPPRGSRGRRARTRSTSTSPIARWVVSLPPTAEIRPDGVLPDAVLAGHGARRAAPSASPSEASGRTPAYTERMSLVLRPAPGKASFAASSR